VKWRNVQQPPPSLKLSPDINTGEVPMGTDNIHRRCSFEPLESRRLLSVSIDTIQLAAAEVRGVSHCWVIPQLSVAFADRLLVSRDGTIAGKLASFTGYMPPGDYSAVIDWGDGHVSAGVIRGEALHFAVEGSHTYTTGGEYDVSMIIRTSDGAAAAGVRTPVKPFADPLTITRQPQLDNSIACGYPRNWEQHIGAFADVDPADPSAYSVRIDWGDGTITAGKIYQLGQGNFGVAGTHDYARGGTYPLSYTVTRRVGDLVVTVTAVGDAIIHDDPLQPGDVRPYKGHQMTVFSPPAEDLQLTGVDDEPEAPAAADFAADVSARSGLQSILIGHVAADLFADGDPIIDQLPDPLA
jgi:hypothetical protein